MNIIKDVDEFVKETPQAKGKSYETWIKFMTKNGVIWIGVILYILMDCCLYPKDKSWAIFFLFMGILWGIFICYSFLNRGKKKRELMEKHLIAEKNFLSLYDDFNYYEIIKILKSANCNEPEKLTKKLDQINNNFTEIDKMLNDL